MSPARALLRWYAAHHRDLPWRRTRDPYCIWVSEIMLQQTRAEVVIPYYTRFLQQFPTIATLAEAAEEQVLARWSGLGYYSRARNLHRAARAIDGAFPADYDAIRELPGIGDYTAAAIASIAFDLPHAVLDGNVMRVAARLTNDASDIGSARTRDRFRTVVQQWLDPRQPGAFNQAMMELGATVCLPRAPKCGACPLAKLCEARREGRAQQLPVKLRKMQPVKIAAALVVIERNGSLLLWQRGPDSRRLAGFWELPEPGQITKRTQFREIGRFRHTITHHHYLITVQTAKLPAKAPLTEPLQWVPIAELPSIPLSTTARKALHLAGVDKTTSH